MKSLEHFNLTKKLHTDVLEEKYGPIHSEVLEHSMFLREAFLCDKDGTGRTYALSFFEQDVFDPDIRKIDDAIKNGGLIGKTFREHGFEVRKNVTSVFVLEMPEWMKQKFGSEENAAKARLSEFYAKKNEGEPLVYATVMEVYSPDFRPAEINSIDEEQIHPSTAILEHAGLSRQEIWNGLEQAHGFDSGNDPRYKSAVDFSQRTSQEYKSRFLSYIQGKQ